MLAPGPRRAAAALVAVLSLFAAVPAVATAAPQDLRVMVRNLYVGADLAPLAGAPDRQRLEQAATERLLTVAGNDFARRAKALAAEIALTRPDLVAVQEAAAWRTGPKDGAASTAGDVVADMAPLLLAELRRRGRTYRIARARDRLDLEVPGTETDVRVVASDLVLARSGSRVRLGRTSAGGFTSTSQLSTAAGAASNGHGWVAVDAHLAGRRFRFVATQLDASAGVATEQMRELLAGPAADAGLQTVLAGDLGPQARALRPALRAGFVNPLPRRATCCFAEDLRTTTEEPRVWADHVVVRPRIRSLGSGITGIRQSGGLFPSDHAGVWTTLRLR